MYSCPSTSYIFDPAADAINGGVPPTALTARTGLFTPPGIYFLASSKRSSDLLVIFSLKFFRYGYDV
jgi:hypothetical protein